MRIKQSDTENGLLAALSEDDYALLQPNLTRIALVERQTLIEANRPIEHVHFLESGVASIVSDHAAGAVEVGIIGREGMTGTAVVLGTDRMPYRSFVQVGGHSALRISVGDLRCALSQSKSLQTLLLRYVQAVSVQATETAAANAQFGLTERLARCLLMCHDRSDDNNIALTHGFIGVILAVRRASITDTLHVFENTRAVRSARGLVTVLDRGQLETFAGECYGRAEAEYRRLIGPFGKSGARANIPAVSRLFPSHLPAYAAVA